MSGAVETQERAQEADTADLSHFGVESAHGDVRTDDRAYSGVVPNPGAT